MQHAMGDSCSAQLLADVGLGSCSASTVAWCPVSGIVAAGARVGPDLAAVHLLNVHCVSRKVTLYVPLAGPEDELHSISWSPAGCRRLLLVATLRGRLSAWSQQPPEGSTPLHVTMQDWWCHDITQLPAAGAGAGPDTPAAACGNGGDNLLSVRWLLPAASWVWDAARVAAAAADFKSGSLVDLFSAAAAGAQQQQQQQQQQLDEGDAFHWVRPGTLALAAVQASGHVVLAWATWSAYGQLTWHSSASLPLATPSAPLAAADAATTAGGVAVAYSLQQQPGAIHLAVVGGNPLHLQGMQPDTAGPVQLPVAQLLPAGGCAAGGNAVSCLSWEPSSQGRRLASFASSSSSSASSGEPGGGQLQLWQLAATGELEQQGSVAVDVAPATQQQLAWLLDGLMVWGGACRLALYTTAPLQLAASACQQPGGHFHTPGGTAGRQQQLVALAASPHGVAVAAVLQCRAGRATSGGSTSGSGSISSRLLLYNVPPLVQQQQQQQQASGRGSDGDALVRTIASRLLWTLVQQLHAWDVVQHTLWHARPPASAMHVSTSRDGGNSNSGGLGAVQPARVACVMALVDGKLPAQTPTLKSTFSLRWDVVKLGLLAGTPCALARTVGVDLRLRLITHLLRPLYDIMREESSLRSRDGLRSKLVGVGLLHSYISDLLAFQVACIKTWVVRRAGSSGGAEGGSADAALVPCIRHFLDWRPNHLLLAAYMACVSPAPGAAPEPLYSSLKYMMKAAPPNKDPNWEAAAKTLLPGDFSLHYGDACSEWLASLSLPPDQLLRHLDNNPVWQQQHALSDDEIAAAAARLGLLPARSPLAIGMYRHELELHGSSFRRQLQPSGDGDCGGDVQMPSVQPAQAAGLKRRRWQQQLGDALGDVLSSASSTSSHVVDLAHFCDLDTHVPGILQSVDGAVVALQSMAGVEHGKGLPKGILEHLVYGWVYACPITGEMWLRTPC